MNPLKRKKLLRIEMAQKQIGPTTVTETVKEVKQEVKTTVQPVVTTTETTATVTDDTVPSAKKKKTVKEE